MIYLKLFVSFLQIGMFSFGGGYAAMPLIQGQVVNGHQWLTMAEFTDLITICLLYTSVNRRTRPHDGFWSHKTGKGAEERSQAPLPVFM